MLALPTLDDQYGNLLDRQAAFIGASATMTGLTWQITLAFEGLQKIGLVSLDDILRFGVVFAGRKRQRNEVVQSPPDSRAALRMLSPLTFEHLLL